MSNCTLTVQNTLNWIGAFIVQRPTVDVGSIPLEPGLTSANKVLQTILGPPFKWPWNRKETSFVISNAGGTDYTQTVSDFGFLEKCCIRTGGTTTPSREVEVVQVLASEQKDNVPHKVAALIDNNDGTIVFRFFPIPDATYTAYLTYQKAPTLMTLLTNTWAPIPDRLAFLYEVGLLAMLQLMYSPQLYAMNMELFFRQLVGAAEGLTDTERAIFLEDQFRQLRAQQTALGGQAARLQRGG